MFQHVALIRTDFLFLYDVNVWRRCINLRAFIVADQINKNDLSVIIFDVKYLQFKQFGNKSLLGFKFGG
jgi:hypothetical protein